MNSVISNRQKQKKSWLSAINVPELTIASIGFATITLAIENTLFSRLVTITCGLLVTFISISTRTNWLKDSKFNQFLSKEGVLPVIGIAVVLAFCLYFLLQPEVSYAFFMKNAEEKLTGAGGLGSFITDQTQADNLNNMIKLIFVAYRFVMFGYIVVSGIKVAGSMREDEDWKAVAKIPAVVLIVMTLLDISTVLIFGT